MQKYPTVVPYLIVPDGDAELAFLKAAFGGVVRECHYDGSRVAHAEVEIGNSLVMVGQPATPPESGKPAIHLWVDDADRAYADAIQAGATRERDVADMPFGQRMGGVVDPAGVSWWIASPSKT